MRYEKKTRDILVAVEPIFLEEQSSPSDDHFVWAYRVAIENQSGETVQLVNRYWRITDARGHFEEVRGPGVVGEQPILQPGERFQYTSGAPLKTPSGMMFGSYEMRTQAGAMFDAEIPPFSLDSPHECIQFN